MSNTLKNSDAQLHPTNGVRFLYVLVPGAGSQAAEYDAFIYTPTECFSYHARFTLEGTCEFKSKERRAKNALEQRLEGIGRVIARDAARKQAEGLVPWPSRVLRWRK